MGKSHVFHTSVLCLDMDRPKIWRFTKNHGREIHDLEPEGPVKRSAMDAESLVNFIDRGTPKGLLKAENAFPAVIFFGI